MKRGKQVGIWGGSRAKKGWFRRALRLDARRCGLPLRPSALHHSSCGLATPAPRIRRCGGNSGPSLSESTPWRQQRPGSRSRHRGGARIRRFRSRHSFGSGSFGLDTAMALAPLVRPFGSPALTPLVRSLGSSPSASCPAPLFRRFRLAVRGIAPCDARCWLPDNWASMSLLAVLLKFARYA